MTKEVKRASRLTCFYCKQRGASIGCCHKGCRKSFHLSCANKNDCLVQFYGQFASFCHAHHGIETASAVHSNDDVCVLCVSSMGAYHPIKSIPLLCCDSGWCHKDCLKMEAFSKADQFNCPSCHDEEAFYIRMLMNGIYIPNR